MDRAAILISLASLVIVSMDLSLSVLLSEKKADAGWARWNVVLCAALLGMSVFFTLSRLSSFLFSGAAYEITNLVFEIIYVVDTSFIIVFLCRFVNWLIARPMSKLEIVITFVVGILYLGISVLTFIHPNDWFVKAQSMVAAVNIAYCTLVMSRNWSTLENRLVKDVVLVFNIISLSVLPLLVTASVIPVSRGVIFALVQLAYFVTYMTFMYIALEKAEKAGGRKKEEPKLEDWARFHITEREFSVIKLIKKGLTNKEIGFELGISVNTVNNHIANIFQKTGVRSRIDLLNTLEEEIW